MVLSVVQTETSLNYINIGILVQSCIDLHRIVWKTDLTGSCEYKFVFMLRIKVPAFGLNLTADFI